MTTHSSIEPTRTATEHQHNFSGRQSSLPAPLCPLLLPIKPRAREPVVTMSKEKAAEDFHRWYDRKSRDPNQVIVLSDGSQQAGGVTGYGFVTYQGGQQVSRGRD